MEYDIKDVAWDLVVLDEAHKLRNVYRSDNKIGKAIRDAIQDRPKILLTATPLQNSLLELYGLVSLIDPYIFGDLKSFKLQFARLSGEDARYEDLRQRIAPICQRTLRRDVGQYVKYTKREALTESYFPAKMKWRSTTRSRNICNARFCCPAGESAPTHDACAAAFVGFFNFCHFRNFCRVRPPNYKPYSTHTPARG